MNNVDPSLETPTSPKTPKRMRKRVAIILAVVVLAAYPVAEGISYIQQVQALHDRINHGTDAFWANPCYDGPGPTTNASTQACYYTLLTQQDQSLRASPPTARSHPDADVYAADLDRMAFKIGMNIDNLPPVHRSEMAAERDRLRADARAWGFIPN